MKTSTSLLVALTAMATSVAGGSHCWVGALEEDDLAYTFQIRSWSFPADLVEGYCGELGSLLDEDSGCQPSSNYTCSGLPDPYGQDGMAHLLWGFETGPDCSAEFVDAVWYYTTFNIFGKIDCTHPEDIEYYDYGY